MMISQKQRAYTFIREGLLGGVFPAGTRISDFSLCKQLGISRAPVREAISQLASEGLLEQIPHYGSFVKRLSRDELDELFDLREMLESHAASRAAERIGPAQIGELKQLCEEMLSLIRKARDMGMSNLEGELLIQQIRGDVAFHLSILRVAERPRLLQVVGDLRILTNLFSQRRPESSEKRIGALAMSYREHCLIVRALESGDADLAAERMRHHIRQGKEKALACFDAMAADDGKDESDLVRSAAIQEMVRKMETYR